MKGIFQRRERKAGRGGVSTSITYSFHCAVMNDNQKEQVKVLTRVREDNPTGSFDLRDIASYESAADYNAAADERKAAKQREDALASVRKLTPAQLAAARAMTDEDVLAAIANAEAKAAAKAKADAEAKAEADAAAAAEAETVAAQ